MTLSGVIIEFFSEIFASRPPHARVKNRNPLVHVFILESFDKLTFITFSKRVDIHAENTIFTMSIFGYTVRGNKGAFFGKNKSQL